MKTERPKRKLTESEEAVIAALYERKEVMNPTNGYVTTTEEIPMGSKDDNGPWGGNPEKMIPAGTTLKIVMISRFEDFGLTDDLDATYGYGVRLDFEDAAMTDIRLIKEPTA